MLRGVSDLDNAKKNNELFNFVKDKRRQRPLLSRDESKSAGGDLSDSWVWVELQIRGRNEPHLFLQLWPNGAGLAAALAKGDGPDAFYIVEPTGALK